SSSTLKRAIRREKIGHLGSYGQSSSNFRYDFDAEEQSGGRIEWVGAYNDSTCMMLRHMMGTVTDSGGGPYVHTYALKTPPDPSGLSIEQIYGTGNLSNNAQVFEGGRVNSWSASWAAGEPLRFGADCLFE